MSDEKKIAGQAASTVRNDAPAEPVSQINPFDDRPSAKSNEAPESTETGEQEIAADDGGDDDDASLGGEFSVDQLKSVIIALQDELEKKSAEADEKHNQLLRAVAETENVRRRLEKEKEATSKYAITKFAMDVLTVGDNFQRAIDAVPKDAVDADPALKMLIDGVVLAERDFQKALERHGVKPIDPAGQPFNPHCHQAVMEQEDPSVAPGTVLRVFQIGYMIDERCLRPAMVVVSRGGAKAEKPAETGVAPPSDGNGQV
jgi:molecular chaperone GrpE